MLGCCSLHLYPDLGLCTERAGYTGPRSYKRLIFTLEPGFLKLKLLHTRGAKTRGVEVHRLQILEEYKFADVVRIVRKTEGAERLSVPVPQGTDTFQDMLRREQSAFQTLQQKRKRRGGTG